MTGTAHGSVTKTGHRGALVTIGGPLFVGTFRVDDEQRELRFVLDDRYLAQTAPITAPRDRPGADKTRW